MFSRPYEDVIWTKKTIPNNTLTVKAFILKNKDSWPFHSKSKAQNLKKQVPLSCSKNTLCGSLVKWQIWWCHWGIKNITETFVYHRNKAIVVGVLLNSKSFLVFVSDSKSLSEISKSHQIRKSFQFWPSHECGSFSGTTAMLLLNYKRLSEMGKQRPLNKLKGISYLVRKTRN